MFFSTKWGTSGPKKKTFGWRPIPLHGRIYHYYIFPMIVGQNLVPETLIC